MSEHTPGPWAIIGEDANGPEHDSIPFIDVGRWDETDSGSPFNRSIAEVTCTITDDDFVITDVDRANARLIAASPDLLEALEEFVSGGGMVTMEVWEQARAAIAKAKGEDA